MRPLLVPTQITPAATLDVENDSIDPPGAGAPAPVAAAAAPRPARAAVRAGGVTPFGYPRSGLSFFQCIPPSVVDIRYWNPSSSSCGFVAENAIGWLPTFRSARLVSIFGLTLIHCASG